MRHRSLTAITASALLAASTLAIASTSNAQPQDAQASSPTYSGSFALSGEEAAHAFHSYGSFAIGSTLVLAARLNLGTPTAVSAAPAPTVGEGPREATRRALEAMMDVSCADPERDEQLFLDGLRRLIASFTPRGDGAPKSPSGAFAASSSAAGRR